MNKAAATITMMKLKTFMLFKTFLEQAADGLGLEREESCLGEGGLDLDFEDRGKSLTSTTANF